MASDRLMKKSGLLKRFFSYLFLIAAANSEISVCKQVALRPETLAMLKLPLR
jgi:hypothetical protein